MNEQTKQFKVLKMKEKQKKTKKKINVEDKEE